MQRFNPVSLVWLLLLFACQPQENLDPHLVSDWQPTAGPERTPLPTSTIIPAATPAFDYDDLQATPAGGTPLPVPTAAPTEPPPFVYFRESDGFMFPYPDSWEIAAEEGTTVRIGDSELGMLLSISSDFIQEGYTFEVLLDDVMNNFTESLGFRDLDIIEAGEIPFAGEGMAQSAFVSGYREEGDAVAFRLIYAEQAPHAYTFLAFGEPDSLIARQKSLETLVSQVTVQGGLFGLNRDETLVLLGGDPLARSLDPARQTGSAAGYVGLLYSGLVRLGPDLRVEPDLAESWHVSEDGTVYTFTLRENLAFASGKKLTAVDVAASWERAADPATDSTTASTYLGDILGVTEKLAGEAEEIAGLDVVDERTLVVTLTGPIPYFLIKLTYPTSFVVDVASVAADDEDWAFEPNPSGPYLLADYREGDAMIFAANEAYHSPPMVANVVYLASRAGSATSLFNSGEIDIVYLNSTEAMEVRNPNDPLHEQWMSATLMCTTLIQMNNLLPPMDDPNVRLAFALAVDKSGLNNLISDGLDVLAHTILPPAMPGFSLELSQDQAAAEFDTAAAQAALAASAYANGLPPITISASGFGDTERDDLNFMVEDWRQILGAEVTIERIDPTEFTQSVRENHGQMVAYGWCADYPDPENFLDILYHSGSDFNVAGYNDSEVDALLEEARTEIDSGRRLMLYQDIERRLLADGAAIPLIHGVSDALVNSRIEGFVLSPMGVPMISLLSLVESESGE